MQKRETNQTALIIAYICLVLLLGSHLLLNSKFLLNHNTRSELPIDFLLRFGIFWFISFVMALLCFVAHIKLHHYSLSDAEITQSAKVGTFAFVAGVCFATFSGIVFYTLA